MFIYQKKNASASGRLRPQTPYRGFAPGHHWETSLPSLPQLCPLLSNPGYAIAFSRSRDILWGVDSKIGHVIP